MASTVANCAFCAIIRGETPAVRVLETGSLLAFLDHRPLFLGHTLLVPKDHMRLLSDLPAELAGEFLMTAQRLERGVEDGLGAAGSMILVNNVVSQSVPHLHLHVIPRNFKDGLRFWLGPRQRYDAEHPAEEYAEKIRAALPPAREATGSAWCAAPRRSPRCPDWSLKRCGPPAPWAAPGSGWSGSGAAARR